MLSGFLLQFCIRFESPQHPRIWVMAWSLCRNIVIELHLWFTCLMKVMLMMVITYIKCWLITYMLSISCKHMILITLNMAKTWLKRLKLVVVGLRVFTTWSHGMSRSWPLGHVGLVLLNVVAQALLYNYCVHVLLSCLLAMPLTNISGKSRLLVLNFLLKRIIGVELSKKVFTSRAGWILLMSSYMLPQMFLLLKHLFLQCLVNLKQVVIT
jgi:hypothetical protein